MFKIYIYTLFILPVCLLLTVSGAFAQGPQPDTLKLSITQAEDLFLKNNLQIIIQRYNIDNASAQVITARLFPQS